LRLGEALLKSLTNAAAVTIATAAVRPPGSAIAVLGDAEVILPLEGLIDKEAELAKLRKTHADLERQIGPLKAKLANLGFVSRAPAEVVEGQRARLAELETQRAAVAALIDKDGPG
jgi:valyl-tRNA synthetase